MKITPLHLENSKEIAQISKRSLDFPWSEATIKETLQSPNTYNLGLFEDRLIGFIFLSFVEREAEIYTFSIDPSHQNQGKGGQLLDQALQDLHLKGVTRIFLEVSVTNKPAINLYTSRKFKEVGRRKNYYKQKDGTYRDALILEKSLT